MLKMISNTLLPDAFQKLDNLELLSLVMDDELTAKRLYNERHDLFRAISAPGEELKAYGLSEKAVSKLKAAIELGRRMFMHKTCPLHRYNTSIEIALLLMDEMRYLSEERFLVLCFNTNNELIGKKVLGQGFIKYASASIREIYKTALIFNSDHIIVAHNHTHGNPFPSTQDHTITDAIFTAGSIMGIPCYDHIIIGNGKYYSFSENKNRKGQSTDEKT